MGCISAQVLLAQANSASGNVLPDASTPLVIQFAARSGASRVCPCLVWFRSKPERGWKGIAMRLFDLR
jgi:hypothetical protein